MAGLDDPLSVHLPEAAAIPRRGAREITLADLASHGPALRRLPPGGLRRALRERDDPYAWISESAPMDTLAPGSPAAGGPDTWVHPRGALLPRLAQGHSRGGRQVPPWSMWLLDRLNARPARARA